LGCRIWVGVQDLGTDAGLGCEIRLRSNVWALVEVKGVGFRLGFRVWAPMQV
jgi:hypothetical protein